MKIQHPSQTTRTTVIGRRKVVSGGHNEDDMTEMLNELRVLLPGAQLLTGFLITLPFNSGFKEIVQSEKWVFMAAFLCSLTSLILFTAPAVQHRMLRPLLNRVHFKDVASRQMLTGAVFLSLALVLCANLVTSEVVGHPLGGVVAAIVTSLILAIWWIYPWRSRHIHRQHVSTNGGFSRRFLSSDDRVSKENI